MTAQQIIADRLAQVYRDVVSACLDSTWPMYEARMYRMYGVSSDAGLMCICQELSRRQLFDGDMPGSLDIDDNRPLLGQDKNGEGIDWCVPRSCR